MGNPRDDGRQVPPPTPGAEARRELWRPGAADEAEADRLGTTRALEKPADPAVTEALGVDPSAPPPAGRSLVVFVLVLVQRLYLAVERLIEGVNAIREALAREPQQPAWAIELARALPRIESAVGGLPDTEVVRGLRQDLRGVAELIATATSRLDRAEAPRTTVGPPPAPPPRELPAGIREALDRIDAAVKTLAGADTVQRVPQRLEGVERKLGEVERRMPDAETLHQIGQALAAIKLAVDRIESGRKDPNATMVLSTTAPTAMKPLGRVFMVVAFFTIACLSVGVVGMVLEHLHSQEQTTAVVVAPQTELIAEVRALRESNVALAAKVAKVVRCGHEECPRSALNAETGKWDRTQCRWVTEQCPERP